MEKPTHKLFKDLTGQIFGMYTVLEYAGEAWPEKKRNRGHQWKCLCECGKERVVIGNCLKSGKSTGCGCARNKHRLIDLKGKKFGKLTVLAYSKVKNKQPFWLCECECGTQKEIMGCNLRESKSKSCGCMQGGVIHGLSGKKGYKKYLFSDPIKKIKHNVGISINDALKAVDCTKKGKKTFRSLPYTAQELKDHLESQFEDWMNWDNYGGRMNDPKKTWHMDHIVPHSNFPYTSLEDKSFQECWELSNLRPLEKIANVKKRLKLLNNDMSKFKEWLHLNESMSVYVQGHDHQSDVHDLDDIANSLKRKVLYPAWDKLSKEQQTEVEERGSNQHQMIAPDGDYYGNGKKLINFYTGGWPKKMVSGLVQGIKYFLDEMKIKYGPFKTEKSGMFNSEVVRIPILQFGTSENPALLNMSNANAILIFRDLLKFPAEEDGFVDISPADLYRKIEMLEKDMVDLHAREPYGSQKQGSAAFFSGGLSSEQITSRLEQIKKVAKWALDNHYDQMYVL